MSRVTTSPVITGKDLRRCKGCDAYIAWVKTQAGKRMPIDAEPDPDGNVELLEDRTARGDLQSRALLPGLSVPIDRRHKSHFATCPVAGRFRG